MMLVRNKLSIIVALALVCSLSVLGAACQTTSQPKPAAASAAPVAVAAAPVRPTMAKLCGNCHTPQPGVLRGNFDSVAYKTQSVQIKIDDATEILRFDENLKLANIQAPADAPDQPLRALKKGKEVSITYSEKDGKKLATLIVAKPAIKVPIEKQVKTEEVEKLVAQGPEKGKYLLIDARPAPRFQEGALPTAVNIPFAAFDKMVDKLPKEKDALIVYYCAGET
jgi:hypothetical protein